MSGVPKWYKYELDEIQKIGKGEMRVSTKKRIEKSLRGKPQLKN